VLDARGDQIMKNTSSEGRPPPRWLRHLEWRLFATLAVAVLVGLLIWIVVAGLTTGPVIAGIVYALVLAAGMSPVIFAGALRGREERQARATAESEQGGAASTTSPSAEANTVVVHPEQVNYINPAANADKPAGA
jgi:Flp pilus assembly protein TadB